MVVLKTLLLYFQKCLLGFHESWWGFTSAAAPQTTRVTTVWLLTQARPWPCAPAADGSDFSFGHSSRDQIWPSTTHLVSSPLLSLGSAVASEFKNRPRSHLSEADMTIWAKKHRQKTHSYWCSRRKPTCCRGSGRSTSLIPLGQISLSLKHQKQRKANIVPNISRSHTSKQLMHMQSQFTDSRCYPVYRGK